MFKLLVVWAGLVLGSSCTSVGFSEQLSFKLLLARRRDHPTSCRPPLLDPRLQCGILEVPLDYHNSSAGRGQVYYARYPARAGVARKGTIFVDPGLPFADSTIGLSPQLWMYTQGEAMHNLTLGEYDVVVWDARGKGIPGANLTIPGPVTCFDPSNDTERNEFYARAARELGVEPSWDENLRWDHLQSKEDALLWTAIQEKVVEHCLSKADTSMMQYVGTAATTRDLVAMADTFDGPGAPINYFGMGHGSLVGSYLLKMFPERVRRVVLDNPVDPVVYTQEDSIQNWKADIQRANLTFSDFAQGCINDEVNGCRLAISEEKRDPSTLDAINYAIALARGWFVGWSNQLKVDMEALDSEYGTFLWTVHQHSGSPAAVWNATANVAAMTDVSKFIDESSSLGAMPIMCGDIMYDHDSEEMRRRAESAPGTIASAIGDAPIIMRSVVPSLRYMCHLWPYRAVERYSEFGVRSGDRPPAHPVLIIGNDLSPLSQEAHTMSVLRQLWKAEGEDQYDSATIIMQAHFGLSMFSHGKCGTRMIEGYLNTNKLPRRMRCYGNGVEDYWPAELDEFLDAPAASSDDSQGFSLSPPAVPLPIRPCGPRSTYMPTGWTSSWGNSVLFYAQALGDYKAQTETAGDMSKGDIIAVTQVNENGWWYGEQVDESRRPLDGFAWYPHSYFCLV